jgi:hypothetical protein
MERMHRVLFAWATETPAAPHKPEVDVFKEPLAPGIPKASIRWVIFVQGYAVDRLIAAPVESVCRLV